MRKPLSMAAQNWLPAYFLSQQTGRSLLNCANGDCSPWMLFGLAPLIPSSFGSKVDDIIDLQPKPKGVNWPKNHLLPREFRQWFKRIGINIDHYMVSIPLPLHEAIHDGIGGWLWNAAWREWIKNNPNATPQDVFKQVAVMIHQFGLDGYMTVVPKKK